MFNINLIVRPTQKYRPGPWCDLLPLSGLVAVVTIESVLVHGCRPTVCSTVRISIRPSARAPQPPSKAAAAHRPATSMRTRSVGRSIAAGPAGQQIGSIGSNTRLLRAPRAEFQKVVKS